MSIEAVEAAIRGDPGTNAAAAERASPRRWRRA